MYVHKLIYMYGQKKGSDRVSPRTGRPTVNPKTERLEIRLTKQQAQDIEECAEVLKVNRTEAIIKGIELLKAEIGHE